MKREECYDHILDRQVFDLIEARYGTEKLTAEIVDEIRVEAYIWMSELIAKTGPLKGLFEQMVYAVYELKYAE